MARKTPVTPRYLDASRMMPFLVRRDPNQLTTNVA